MIVIEDSRQMFKKSTFSNYKKSDVIKNLTTSIYYGKQEESFFYTCEMLCSNMIIELWNVIFLIMSKHIHIYNPKLPVFIYNKYNDFRHIALKHGNDFTLRNDQSIRNLFCTIILILCCSQKFTILDDMKYKFNFKLENLYENLKAPHIKYIDKVYLNSDPKEYLIPFNELIYHLYETKQKIDIHFWINWIIHYDVLCRKKKKIILCQQRDIFINNNEKLSKNIVWIIWDCVLKLSKETSKKEIQRIIESIFELFKIRYSFTCNKTRIHLIYHSIELILLSSSVNLKIEILKERQLLKTLEQNIETIFEQIKSHEQKLAPNENKSISEKKIDLYQNIYNNL